MAPTVFYMLMEQPAVCYILMVQQCVNTLIEHQCIIF